MTQKTGAAHRVIVRTGGAMSSAGLRSRSGISFDFLERLLATHRSHAFSPEGATKHRGIRWRTQEFLHSLIVVRAACPIMRACGNGSMAGRMEERPAADVIACFHGQQRHHGWRRLFGSEIERYLRRSQNPRLRNG